MLKVTEIYGVPFFEFIRGLTGLPLLFLESVYVTLVELLVRSYFIRVMISQTFISPKPLNSVLMVL